MNLHKLWPILLGLILIACTPTAAPQPSAGTQPQQTAASTTEAAASPTPSATPTPRKLTLCLGSEPASLYLYGDTYYAATLIREAIYDGPIDMVGYAYQPVIVEKLPSFADGDASIESVTVEAGDRIVDADNLPGTLVKGMRVRPAGCRAPDCEITFDGNPLAMDQMRATFTLKPDVRWADGQAVSAADSVFSFELASQAIIPHSQQWQGLRTASYVALDERRVEWTGMPGFFNTEYANTFWTPLPKHAWEYYETEEIANRPDVGQAPWGYGPYFIETWIPGVEIRAQRNPHYFRSAEGLPYFDEIVFRFLDKQDINQVLDTLKSGQCDILGFDLYLERGWQKLQTMEQAGEAQTHIVPGPIWEHLTFNANPPENRQLLFSDPRMRQAVAYCIDRQEIIDALLHGLSPIPHSYIPEDHPLYAGERLSVYQYDPTLGQALLDEVGWRDEDGDGQREAHAVPGIPEGTPLELSYATTTSETRTKVSAHIVTDLAACGIQVNVEQNEPLALFADGPDSPAYGGNFDLISFAWLTGLEPRCELYSSSTIPEADNLWSGENIGGYANPFYDALCTQALNTLPGQAVYESVHQEAQRIWSEDLPALPLFQQPRIHVATPHIHGLIADPLSVETWNIESFRWEP